MSRKKKKKKKRNTQLSVRQKQLVREVLKGTPPTDAALKVGYCAKAPPHKKRKAASKQASLVLRSPLVKEFMREALEKSNINPNRIAVELDKGLREGEIGNHDSYLKLAANMIGAIDPEKPTDGGGGPLRLDVMLGIGDVTSEERIAFGEAMIAIRISRGLHPEENRRLTPEEIARLKNAGGVL